MPPSARTTYRYRITFDAPLPFVYRWCTDYREDDARLEGDSYRRRVLSRNRRRVVYEDLTERPDGWSWARHVITLHPPNRWTSDSVGNRRLFRLDYRLRTVKGGRTEMQFVGRRTPTPLGARNPTARSFAADMESAWTRFRRHLERDYRARSRKAGARRRRA